MEELKKQAHKEFENDFKGELLKEESIVKSMYLNGKFKSFIDSLIEKTVQITEERWLNQSANEHDKRIRQDERERMVGVIKEYPERLLQIMPEGKLPFVVFQGKADEDEKKTIYFQAIKDIISLFTNKSDINK